MKRLSMIMVCLFAMMAAGTGLKAQEISILLRPGWNWIGYPYPETVDLENAFGDFEPMTDDVIESFWGYSEYVAGYGWFGGIDELKPGWGYMYYSNRTEPVTIVFSPSFPTVEPITVTTAEPTEITANSAVSGGSITSNDGNYIYVIQKGICWATHPNPMVMNDSLTESGSGAESFTAEMTDLSPNTDYYVRAYAVTLDGTFYGDELNFITLDDGGSNVPEGAINGLFSINANGDQVYFSQGNLQYRASTNTWRFAENQQDIIGYANSNISSTYDGWIDLFGWGTSGYDDKYPWMTSMNETDYGDNQNNIAYTEYDWGQHNPISNGGNQAGLWRTLSSAELGYMIYQRDNWQNLYAMGLVNGWHGLIILPDDFVLPENITFTPDYKLFTDDVNNFSLEEWSQMESLGAVFLPVAGIREGTQVREVDASGLYWSTDILSPDDGAREMWFGAAYIYYNPGIGGTFGRHCGISIRLVHDANQAFTSYAIEATPNPSNGGTITGTGFYAEGATCTLTAIVNDGYIFDNWTENGEVVSAEANYSFTVMSNRNLVANFTAQSGAPIGAIDGLFTINAEGGQVQFSQGNLQYQASTNTWRFAESQWDYVGADNSNISSEYDGWIDLFGWGTSGYHNIYDNFNVNYQPYSTSSAIVHTECNYYGYGPSTNMYDPNLTGMSAEYDWGVHNAINNGGNQAGSWRTLSREEWQYVLFTRSASTVGNTSNARFAKATVNGVSGVILFPDVFSVPIYLPTPLQINNSSASFGVNSYSADGWTALENLGCAFMPVAGYRQGTSISDTGSLGYYWSSSYSGYRSALCVSIHNFQNYSNPLDMTTNYRYTGCSVRLVHDVE